MHIPDVYREAIINTDINATKVHCLYHYWFERFENNVLIADKINLISKTLGEYVTRSALVNFYQDVEIPVETKFIATMIWGNEAVYGGTRDARGPWRVENMFANYQQTIQILNDAWLDNNNQLEHAYNTLGGIKKCGPNFFTKHLYFQCKSLGNNFPLIFDNRVTKNLVRILFPDFRADLNFIAVQTERNAAAYLRYLTYMKDESHFINCNSDQLEYFLFGLEI